ncbi:hypothetical protein [Actinomadura litoris]|uniref:hypothetical protein n=1 Tax=Actinomadura litoris TaxID=2678616 RepID=UPI001FA76B66|nr:hypothetical protein [Actinomadura litoris]
MYPFRRRYNRSHLAVLIPGFLFTFVPLVVGVVLYAVPDQPYKVHFRDGGDPCSYSNDSLTLDSASGSELKCGTSGSGGAPDGPWTSMEASKIESLARSLAMDGLSDRERRRIRDEAERIAATRGYPKRDTSDLLLVAEFTPIGVLLLLLGPRLQDKSMASIEKNRSR